jgi:hypothetical protein
VDGIGRIRAIAALRAMLPAYRARKKPENLLTDLARVGDVSGTYRDLANWAGPSPSPWQNNRARGFRKNRFTDGGRLTSLDSD